MEVIIEKSKTTVAVLMGGIGEERDISIQSGNCVAHALKEAGFNVVTADIGPDRLDILDSPDIDVFFPALHGRFGEDGQLQQILQDKSLIYTGSGPEASRLAFDKLAGKKVFAQAGINTPPALEIQNSKLKTQNFAMLEQQLRQIGSAYVIKPRRQGSSVGISIVTEPGKAIVTAQKTAREFGDCLIEKFIPGKEITVGIISPATRGRGIKKPPAKAQGLIALPIIEIKSKTGFYDYQAKYIDERTEYLFDTISDPILIARIESAAIACFNALGCRHFARVDFILDQKGIAYALEVNTIPGFTTHSLLPKAAAKAGLSMSQLCTRIVEAAVEKRCPLDS